MNSGAFPQKVRRVSLGAVRNPASEEAILQAAGEILEEEGYSGFTIQAVVSRAQSSKPTIYRRWRNKCSLIMAVYERGGEATLEMPDTGSLEEDLVSYLTAVWKWWTSSRAGEVLRSFVTEAQLDPASVKELREDFIPRRARLLRAIFQRAALRGDIKSGSCVDTAVALLMGISLMRLMADHAMNAGDIKNAVRIVVEGICTERERNS
jgi:AcrR family transcriptional regulator